jgi:hypothetical protein
MAAGDMAAGEPSTGIGNIRLDLGYQLTAQVTSDPDAT